MSRIFPQDLLNITVAMLSESRKNMIRFGGDNLCGNFVSSCSASFVASKEKVKAFGYPYLMLWSSELQYNLTISCHICLQLAGFITYRG